ncbi:MoaD/ThiS family protein [Marinomonas algarum]|uniref:MoaD/ThiS family protein n=1 Tax=Marinomonas algarum TaxID=2883105 RepID=A0A9X1LFB3_9GAMM|nr:MoaD/ThiS family protein [Marinomonas algarum]MCB5162793.1 MoaD/ThiS family protein [Marinomonas algarum]
MSKVKVVFFASLKEAVGLSEYLVELDLPISVGELRQYLVDHLDKGGALLGPGVQSSVDFEFTRDTDIIAINTREVAFFPPVTGG